MSKHSPILRLFDRVRYTGDKFANLRGTNSIGEIVGMTSDGLYSISYGDECYLLHGDNLRKVDFSEDVNEKMAQKWAKKAKEAV